jgi:hypothetical protein
MQSVPVAWPHTAGQAASRLFIVFRSCPITAGVQQRSWRPGSWVSPSTLAASSVYNWWARRGRVLPGSWMQRVQQVAACLEQFWMLPWPGGVGGMLHINLGYVLTLHGTPFQICGPVALACAASALARACASNNNPTRRKTRSFRTYTCVKCHMLVYMQCTHACV